MPTTPNLPAAQRGGPAFRGSAPSPAPGKPPPALEGERGSCVQTSPGWDRRDAGTASARPPGLCRTRHRVPAAGAHRDPGERRAGGRAAAPPGRPDLPPPAAAAPSSAPTFSSSFSSSMVCLLATSSCTVWPQFFTTDSMTCGCRGRGGLLVGVGAPLDPQPPEAGSRQHCPGSS